MTPERATPEVRSELSVAIERAERGVALYVWRCDADSPWRITDWEGVPGLDSIRDVGRVDLAAMPAEVANRFRAFKDQS